MGLRAGDAWEAMAMAADGSDTVLLDEDLCALVGWCA
jgi:hypothetical protein